MEKKRELEVYIHIPFCVRKCAYCDFLSAPAEREVQEQYLKALLKEISEFPFSEEYEVSTVFLGGGTPSMVDADYIERIMELLYRRFSFSEHPEISIECNPGTADREKLQAYRKAGINRISFGLQSADNGELQLLGRIHTWEQFLETYREARAAGFENINVDLMSSLPGQSIQSWKETLETVTALQPEHISAYSLIIEEGTPFYDRYGADAMRRDEGEVPQFLPSEEAEREMYRLTEECLQEAGMKRYEISNYAKPGKECRHNSGYWKGTEYVGFGLGASSYLKIPGEKMDSRNKRDSENQQIILEKKGSENVPVFRIQNTCSLQQYCAGDCSGREMEEISREDQMAEFMFLGLRMMDGVSEADFEKQFGQNIHMVYGSVIKRQHELGLLERVGGRIWLTSRGIDLSNMVMAEFL